jgi:outer membrane protein assembly factor BamA
MAILATNAFCQEENSGHRSLAALPIVFYTPETNMAFGVFAAYIYRNARDSTTQSPSQIQAGGVYTTRQQLFSFINFRLYISDSKFLLQGETGYYRYSYFFFGIGNRQPHDYRELYRINFGRLRMNAMYRINRHAYLGLKYWFEQYRVVDAEPGRQLASGAITGSSRGVVSGIGPSMLYDTRDSILYPRKGLFIEAGLQFYGGATGSSFRYRRYTFDASAYFTIEKAGVIASNIVFEATTGDVPFNQLGMLGGASKMRGYYEGRYRDKLAASTGMEWRLAIHKRIGAVTFFNFGAVGARPRELINHLRCTYGAGIRYTLNTTEHLNVRFDIAFGKRTQAIYFTIGEAF